MRGLSYLMCFRLHNNAAHGQIMGRQFQPNFVPRHPGGSPGAPPAGNVRQHAVSIGQFYSIHPARQNFNYGTFNFEGTFSGHVNTSG